MIIVTKKDVTQDELDHIRERVESLGLRTHISRGEHRTIVGCVGDEERFQGIPLLSIPGVEAVHAVLKPYKLASRDFAAEPTRIALGDVEVGGDDLVVIAGPCSVEGREMLGRTARAVVGKEPARCAAGRSSRAAHRTPSAAWVRRDSRSSRTSAARPVCRSSPR